MPAVRLAPEAPALVLEASDRAPSVARRYLVERFRDLGHADDFVGRLVVTELVTNVHKHVGFGHVVVRVFADARDGLTMIEVWDEDSAMPVVRDENRDATSGRGLSLVAELVHDWGARALPGRGKIVWARLPER